MNSPKFVPVLVAGLLLIPLVACKKEESGAAKPTSSNFSAASGDSKAAPGEAADLKIKWKQGRRLVYRMDMDQSSTNSMPGMPQPMQQQVHMAMTYSLTATRELPAGGMELEMEYLANEMEVKMGGNTMMSFDSKEPGQADQNPFVAPYRKMIGTKLKFEVASGGSIEKVVGLDAWMEKVAGGLEGPGRGMISQQFNEGYFRQIADFSRGLPPKPVAVGESWPSQMEVPAGPIGKLKLDQKNLFKGWETRENRKTAALSTTGTMTSSGGGGGADMGPMQNMKIEDGKLTGTSWFDPELGNLLDSVSDQAMKVTGSFPAPPNSNQPAPKFTSQIAQKVSIKLVESSEGGK